MTSKKTAHYHHGDLRTALLEVAAEMIALEGVESLTLRALSRQIGVSRTAPYRHFADKSALLVAVAEQGFQRLQQGLDAILLQTEIDPLNRFQQMGLAYIQFAVDNPTHYRLMFSRETADVVSHPALEATAKAVFDTLVTAIQQCQAEDKIRAEEPRSLAYAVWASVHGLSSLLIDERIKNVKNTQELAAFVTQTLLDGITP